MKITPAAASDVVRKVIMSLKNEKAAGTEQLQLLSFKYGGNKFENQMAEIVTKA